MGDVMVKIAVTPIACTLDVQRGMIDREGGKRLPLFIRRDGIERRLELALEAGSGGTGALVPPRPDNRASASLASGGQAPDTRVWRSLGLRLRPLANPAEVSRTHPQLHGGLVVSEVRPESPATRAGLRNGDVLVGLHQWEMLTLENVRFVLEHPDRSTFTPLRFYIVRAGQVHRGWLQPE
jgi:serine protease Do